MRELLDAERRTPAVYAELELYVLTYWPAYRDGHLLVAGGVADQPARYLDMINEMQAAGVAAEIKYLEITAKDKEPVS